MATKKCIVPGCKRPFIARSCCHAHYRKAAREGLFPLLASKSLVSRRRAVKQLELDGRTTRWQ